MYIHLVIIFVQRTINAKKWHAAFKLRTETDNTDMCLVSSDVNAND